VSSEIASLPDVTVLISGPIFKFASDKVPVPDITFKLVQSVRNSYSAMPIVLSTWEIDERFKEFDGLLYHIPHDPGAQIVGDHVSNLNRQITSVNSGIERTNSKFVLRIRSDFLFKNFQKTLELVLRVYNLRPDKIVVLDSSRHAFTWPYHICDFLQFGHIELLKRYWTKSLQTNEEFLYFRTSPNHEYRPKFLVRHLHYFRFPEQYSPEQFLGLRYMFPNCDYPLKHRHNFSLMSFINGFKESDKNFSFIHISQVVNLGRLYSLGAESALRRLGTKLMRHSPLTVRFCVLCFFFSFKLIHNLLKNFRSAVGRLI